MAQEKIDIPILYPTEVEEAVKKVKARTGRGELLEEAIAHCMYEEATNMSQVWKADYTIIHEKTPSTYRIIEGIGTVLPFYHRLTDTLLNVLHPSFESPPEVEVGGTPDADIQDIDQFSTTLDLQRDTEAIILSGYHRTHTPLEFIDFVAKLEIQKIESILLKDDFKNRQKEALEKGRLRFHQLYMASS